ncbi:hypothetical protein [Citrobacter sp. UYEF32]|uniref:hypothetical protein n=1 Tax=Citrobacter sp. UYEF32 TaxID=3156347 RepID=UPI003396F558
MADSPFLWRDITSYRVRLIKIVRNKLQETLASDNEILLMTNRYCKSTKQHIMSGKTFKPLINRLKIQIRKISFEVLSIKIIQLFLLMYKSPEVWGENHCEIVFALKNLAKTDRVLFPKIRPPEYSSFLPAPR